MAVNITATRTTTLFTDQDMDGVFDPGDIVLTRIRITNLGTNDAEGVSVTDTLSGVTLVAGSVQVTPIAFDDFMPSITGNTPFTFTAAQLLGNDVDPDGAEINLQITGVSNAQHGTIVNNNDGTFTFTPTTGYAGSGLNAASFEYTITDEQGRGSVTTGIVKFDVTDPVWYVNNATGSDITGDGSWAKPFASLLPLNTGGSADALDNADDTIFVYNAGTYANASITLETGQKLFGDGHAFSVNGLAIGANASNTTLSHAGVAVTLASGNTVDGLDLVGTAGGAVGIQDGNATVGTLTITGTNITGQGQILDIDQGGTLAVTLGNIGSTGSTGANGGVVDLTGVTGTVTVTGTTTINGTHSQAGIDISGNTGGLAVDFQGNLTVNNGVNNAINIGSNTGTNTVTFSGGTKDIDTTSGTALNLTANTTGTTVSFTNGGLDVDTTSGIGLNMDNTTLVVGTGAGANTVNTATGNVLVISNSAIGAGNIAFDTLGASGSVAAGAGININNLDNGTFSGGNVTIAGTAGASTDGLIIQGASSATFGFASATIGGGAAGTNPIAGDGIELNGANGAVTFATVNVNGATSVGVNIVNASNAVTISGGNIGATNDPGGDGININGGTGAVTVAATVNKTTNGNEVVDVSSHATGNILFSGAITSASGGGGIRLVNNTSGNIDFTNGTVSLNTGTVAGLTFTNTNTTGANVSFTGGNFDITTTTGTGINAQSTHANAATSPIGSLTITGASNEIVVGNAQAVKIDGVGENVTLLKVSAGVGTAVAAATGTSIFLQNAGTAVGNKFVITGTASDYASGGTITHSSNAATDGNVGVGTGIYMNNVGNISLTNMNFLGNFGNFGIRGQAVNNFTLTDSDFSNNNVAPGASRPTFGTAAAHDEDTIRFGSAGSVTGLTGTAVFQGNNIQGGKEVGLSVYVYGSSQLNLTIKDTLNGDQAIFGENYGGTAAQSYNDGTGTDDFLLESGGTSNVTVTVTGVQFNGSRGDLMQIASLNNTVQTINITGNQFHNSEITTLAGGAGVAITGSLTGGNINYNIDGNSFKGTRGSSIYSMFNGSSGTINGIVNNNTFGTANGQNDVQQNDQAEYGSLFGGAFFGGIDSKFPGAGNLNYALRISSNTIRDSGSDGVIMLRSATQDKQGVGRLEATISNNTIAEAGANVAAGIYAQIAGSGATSNGETIDSGKMGLNISNNNINVSAAGFSDGVYVDNGSSTNGLVYFPGYAGPATPFTELSTYLTGKGNVFDAGSKDSGTGGAATNGNVSGGNFVLGVPAMAAIQDTGGGWQDLPEFQVVVPPPAPAGDPAPTPGDTGTGGDSGGGGTGGGGSGGSGGSGSGDPPPAGDDNVLTAGELSTLAEAAISRWIAAGATPAQVEAMRAVQIGIVDMAGIFVGTSTHGVISIDPDGAGYGWFVDSTPGEDSEFEGSGTALKADAGGVAAGKLDLLTVLMHELGHQIGLDDEYMASSKDDLMYGYVNVGERRLPAAGEAAGAVPGSVGATAFALTPVSVGTLPANKSVDIFFKATIDAQVDKYISPLMNTATISGTNFSNVLATENNALDSLTLGSTVFVDANLNGKYDAGEGRSGVAVQLYADTNDSGGWDPGDLLLGSASTGANGAYSFAGLAPGDYIVVVTAANFANGAVLDDLLIVQGAAADPDNNVDNDNNGVAATGGAVASQTITLSYNDEPDGTPDVDGDSDADTNNTLDFGFVANQPPVANDDTVSVAEDSGANDLTSQLLGNDTDPDNDTKTVTSVTQPAVGGTVTLVSGAVTFTPSSNYNGSTSFTYTISDGNGHNDTATVNVTVTAVNDPVTSTAPTTATLNEDAVDFAVTGISIADADAALAPAGVYEVVLQATHGALKLTTTTGLSFTAGDGDGDTTMTFHGTLADLNAALATVKYSPDAHYNGAAQIDIDVTDQFGAAVATGSGAATADSDSIDLTVNSVNDAPAGTDDSANATAGTTYIFLTSDFSDGFSDAIDSDDFAGIKITQLPATGTIKLNGVAILANAEITKTQLDNGNLTYDAPAGGAGTSPTFKFAVRDDGGVLNGGVDYDQSPNTFTLNIGVANAAPAVDLDANGAGTGFASNYTEGGAAAAISDTDVLITDSDSGDDIVSATITITNAETGDKLTVNLGALPGTVTVDGTSTDTMVKLVAAPGTSKADFEAAIEAVTYSSTSHDPTDHGTNTARTITVTVNDGVSVSAAATATVTVADDNADAPTAVTSTITAVEDTYRLIKLADLSFNDADGSFASITITAVSGGGLYFDADGVAGAGEPELVTVLPKTYSAQDLVDGKVSFKAAPNANGNGLGQISFTVTDDDGNVSADSNNLDVNVTATNDSPVLTATSVVNATEQLPIYILTGVTVSDVDLDAKNGGLGDYAGATFGVNRNPVANAQDDFELVAGANFTIDGINLKATDGKIFGYINADANGLISITFNSLETAATSALVDEVIQQIRYMNTSDNPPASVELAAGFTDGSPDGGQGAGATGLDIELVTVNIAPVNDPPVVTAADTTVSGSEDTNLVFNAANGNAITVADVDNSTLTVTLTVLNGRLTLSQTTGLSVTGNGTATVELAGSAANINAALEGLVYRGNLNYEGSDTLGIEVDDGTATDSENVAITLADDGIIHGDSGDNTLYGTPQNDLFLVQQGGNDTVYGLASDDIFYFGNAFTGADKVDGDGGGKDVVVLQGNYNLTLSATNLTGVESLSLKSGAFTFYGDTANNFYDYAITTVDENVAAGAQLIVNGSSLRADEDFTFNGSAEKDGKFLLFGGNGVDNLTGGDGSDIFVFEGTRWGASDSVKGGLGRDSVVITAGNGTTHIAFGPTSLIGIESVTVSNQYSSDPTATPDYEFVLHDGNVASGQTLVVNGFTLTDPGQTISVDGSAEKDGKLILFGGAGTDVLIGGDGADTLYGAGRGDTLTGGAGNDVFRYDNITDSNSAERDGIQDFNSGDLIDLSRIDADSTQAGDQAFTFIGSAAFGHHAGELRFEIISPGGTTWLVQGDTDGNGVSDFEILLVINPPDPITASDFIL